MYWLVQELECMQRVDDEKDEVISEPKTFKTKLMAKWVGLIEKALATFENQDPDAEKFSKVATQQAFVILFNVIASSTMRRKPCKKKQDHANVHKLNFSKNAMGHKIINQWTILTITRNLMKATLSFKEITISLCNVYRIFINSALGVINVPYCILYFIGESKSYWLFRCKIMLKIQSYNSKIFVTCKYKHSNAILTLFRKSKVTISSPGWITQPSF